MKSKDEIVADYLRTNPTTDRVTVTSIDVPFGDVFRLVAKVFISLLVIAVIVAIPVAIVVSFTEI